MQARTRHYSVRSRRGLAFRPRKGWYDSAPPGGYRDFELKAMSKRAPPGGAGRSRSNQGKDGATRSDSFFESDFLIAGGRADGEGALAEEVGADVAVGLEHGDKGGNLLFQILEV